MPRFVIPANAGPFKVTTARAGNPLVVNDYKGKRQVLIPCRSLEQAQQLCQQLNQNPHLPEVFV